MSSKSRRALLQSLIDERGAKCELCLSGLRSLTKHHIIHKECGGSNDHSNLLLLCDECHTKVHREGVPSGIDPRYYQFSNHRRAS